MSNPDTNSVKPPDLVQSTDLLPEFEGNLSGRTTPSSFRESPIGWGMSLVCGGIGYGQIDSREALVNFYQEATFKQQQEILQVLASNDKKARFELLAETMFHACAKNFLDNQGKRTRSQSTLTVYDSIDQFNEVNTMKHQLKKYKLSSVQEMLAGRNSKLVAENILSVCGALGMPYEAMLAFLDRPDIVYKGFKSTFGQAIANVNGTNRGYALWVLYAATRQAYQNATSYVVDDMFYIDVHSNTSQDEDIDAILREIGIVAEIEPQIVGHRFVEVQGKMYLMPDIQFVNEKFRYLVNQAQQGYWEDHPQELNAHMLQLAYVLNPFEEEFAAILGLLQQTSKFVPDISCIDGSVPTTIQDLMASHEYMYGKFSVIIAEMDGTFSIKHHVNQLFTALHRAFRHYARHFKEKEWYIEGKMLSSDQKAQMKAKLYDLVLDQENTGWGNLALDWGGE